jgi:HEAT repeat protein
MSEISEETMRTLVIIAIGLSLPFLGCNKGGGASKGPESEQPKFEGKSATEWLEDFKNEDPESRAEAAKALGALGPDAKSAIPDLAKALNNDEVRVEASEALGHMGSEAVPALVRALGERSMGARRRAGAALAAIGAEAVPALREALKDRNPRVRQEAAVALGMMGPAAADAVGDLAALLKDDEKWVRIYAAQALGDIGPSAKGAVAALEELKDDPGCRARASEAIKQIENY